MCCLVYVPIYFSTRRSICFPCARQRFARMSPFCASCVCIIYLDHNSYIPRKGERGKSKIGDLIASYMPKKACFAHFFLTHPNPTTGEGVRGWKRGVTLKEQSVTKSNPVTKSIMLQTDFRFIAGNILAMRLRRRHPGQTHRYRLGSVPTARSGRALRRPAALAATGLVFCVFLRSERECTAEATRP